MSEKLKLCPDVEGNSFSNCNTIVLKCPYCKGSHVHAGYYGIRISGCNKGKYNIVGGHDEKGSA